VAGYVQTAGYGCKRIVFGSQCWLSLLQNIFEGFKMDRPERSCSTCAAEIYTLLGKKALHPDGHPRFLRDILQQNRDTVIRLIGPVTTFLEKAQDHCYLKEGIHLNENPLKTEANMISGLFYIVTSFFA
jgi:hypothetical protein